MGENVLESKVIILFACLHLYLACLEPNENLHDRIPNYMNTYIISVNEIV